MEHLIEAAANYYVVTLAVGAMLVASVIKSFTSMVVNASRERSRREIAAYIAEGSMSAEQGERLIRADVKNRANCAA